jgi:hypothetical protein
MSKTFANNVSIELTLLSLTTESAIFLLTRLFRLCTVWGGGGGLLIPETSARNFKAKFTQDFIHAIL